MRDTPAPIAALLESPALNLGGRVLLTLPFWSSGIAKLLDINGALAEAAHFGLEPAWATVIATLIVQLGGSAALIVGRFAWVGAGALGVFTALATLIAHPFWNVADPMLRFHERNTFLEHVGLVGGLILAAILTHRKGRH
ncbi:DoxX family protein [Niveispirillum sp.]|uniref:DoxX family protein n=1 Tax=Niveispirillum sp. TaxID=1917217 RepID=UPI001B63E58D|nr:DoxX family protein [Niveispirillum sp.]MBP7337216.1 DoxX family protein [Niveispirillum sp.]